MIGLTIYVARVDYYSFAGNIGAGKSTTASRVADSLRLPLLAERVSGHPYLNLFYADPAQWAFRLQMFNLAERSRQILEAFELGSFVLDRSFEEDLIYVDVALSRGFISDQEHDIYGQLFELALRVLPRPTRLFYLRAPNPDVLHLRIIQRSRGSEAGLDLDYLRELQERYDSWFQAYQGDKLLVESRAGGINEAVEAALRAVRKYPKLGQSF